MNLSVLSSAPQALPTDDAQIGEPSSQVAECGSQLLGESQVASRSPSPRRSRSPNSRWLEREMQSSSSETFQSSWCFQDSNRHRVPRDPAVIMKEKGLYWKKGPTEEEIEAEKLRKSNAIEDEKLRKSKAIEAGRKRLADQEDRWLEDLIE